MDSTENSDVVYVGETIEIDLEDADIEDVDSFLEDFVDLEEGERLHTSLSGGKLVVKKLREQSL